MLRATILIPTHRHAATLPMAVASVQSQGRDEIEILIVGDGANDALRSVALSLAAADRRIRFFDFPKGPRHGEGHRHVALREARGRIVCYQSDDDLWLPNHLDVMEAALKEADFAGGMHVNVGKDGKLRGYYFDLEQPAFREPYLEWRANGLGDWASGGFGLSFAAHSLDAYRRLPEGWATSPDNRTTEHWMWHKFVRQAWCRVKCPPVPVALHFPAPERASWSDERLAGELRGWAEIIARPDGMARVYQAMTEEMGERLLRQKAAEMGRHDQEIRQLRAEAEAGRAWAAERDLRRMAEAERDRLVASTSWRMTAPLRALADRLKALRSRRAT